MFVYKLICIPTKRVYFGTSDIYPDIDFISVPNEVQNDFDNFGSNSFKIHVICELKNTEKAKDKAELLNSKTSIGYNIAFDPEIDQEEISEPVQEPKYEIVERFPEYLIGM